MDIQPDKLFTPESIVGVGVATVAVNVVTNALRRVSNGKLPAIRVAFVTALLVAAVVLGIQTQHRWYDFVLAFFNACLLFCSAMGINEAGVAVTTQPGTGYGAGKGLFSSWLKR